MDSRCFQDSKMVKIFRFPWNSPDWWTTLKCFFLCFLLKCFLTLKCFNVFYISSKCFSCQTMSETISGHVLAARSSEIREVRNSFEQICNAQPIMPMVTTRVAVHGVAIWTILRTTSTTVYLEEKTWQIWSSSQVLKTFSQGTFFFGNQGPPTYCVSLFLAGKLHLNWRASRNFAIMKQNCKAGKRFGKKSCAFPNFRSLTSNFPFRKVECWIFELYLKVG